MSSDNKTNVFTTQDPKRTIEYIQDAYLAWFLPNKAILRTFSSVTIWL